MLKTRFLMAVVLFAALCPTALGATYSDGFAWDWEADFSGTDSTPSDVGSITKPENTGKNSDGPTEDTWAYLNIDVEVPGGFPGGSSEPSTLLTPYVPYFGSYGHAWLSPDGPGIGIDDGPDYNFAPADQGRGFLISAVGVTGRPAVALRWTAPQTGNYDVQAVFRAVATCGSWDGVGVQIVHNTTALSTEEIITSGGSSQTYNFSRLALTVGDRLYFCANSGGGSWECDETVLDLSIAVSASPATPTAGSSVESSLWEQF